MANNIDEDILRQEYEEYMRIRSEAEVHPEQNNQCKKIFFISHLFLTDD